MSKITIRPLGDWVLVEPQKAEKQTAAGLYIPDSASQDRAKRGKVVAVGEGKKVLVKKNENVMYKGYYSDDDYIKDGKKEYLLVKAEDVIAVVEE